MINLVKLSENSPKLPKIPGNFLKNIKFSGKVPKKPLKICRRAFLGGWGGGYFPIIFSQGGGYFGYIPLAHLWLKLTLLSTIKTTTSVIKLTTL